MSARPSLLQHELWELLMLTLSAVSDRRLSNLLFVISILSSSFCILALQTFTYLTSEHFSTCKLEYRAAFFISGVDN